MSIMSALVYYHVGCSGLCGTASDFRSREPLLETFSISFTPLCLCLSEETLKYIYIYIYGVYAWGSKDIPHWGKCVACCGLYIS